MLAKSRGVRAGLILERSIATCLAVIFLGIVLPSIRGGLTGFQSERVVVPLYVAIALVPLLLIVVGQGRLWGLRIAGWLILCVLLGGVIAF